jgi:tetratricopeptide (TPR) repeat protein
MTYDGAICKALAKAFGQTGQYRKAIDYYLLASQSEEGVLTLNDVEQLSYCEAQYALEESSENSKEALELINKSITRISSIFDLTSEGTKKNLWETTSERLSILGEVYRRKAQIDKEHTIQSLEKMRDNYKEAYEKSKPTDHLTRTPALNPLINWISAELALAWRNKQKNLPNQQDLINKITMAETKLTSKQLATPTSMDQLDITNAKLYKTLLGGTFIENAISKIASEYVTAVKFSSKTQFQSIVDHFDFLISMATDSELEKELNRLKTTVSAISANQ